MGYSFDITETKLVTLTYDQLQTKEYKIKTLEKLFIKTRDKKEKILINEKKLNKFKPGVLNLINDIISNGKTKLPRPQDLKNMYKFLEKLPY